MNRADANPFLITLIFILRCLVPLAVILGISYLLRRLKLVAEPPPPPPDWDDGGNGNNQNPLEGGQAHGKV
ncbi:MAG: hypothetical protein A2Z45_05810 [Chloroflexi bacterium RBG_19FT_COMBO_55_16]|nr:MAG: hypothetical protein A2Z45_05810 [Chloroflexi bacterium RBG_19FT_COMBO_55_16]